MLCICHTEGLRWLEQIKPRTIKWSDQRDRAVYVNGGDLIGPALCAFHISIFLSHTPALFLKLEVRVLSLPCPHSVHPSSTILWEFSLDSVCSIHFADALDEASHRRPVRSRVVSRTSTFILCKSTIIMNPNRSFQIFYLFFLNIYMFFIWKADLQRKVEKQRVFPFTGLLPKWLQWSELGQVHRQKHGA